MGRAALVALPGRALFWPAQSLLVVSDLHLGKSERLARRGGSLLPPYDTAATLGRLATDLAMTGAQSVISLGDSFDDVAAGGGLGDDDRDHLMALVTPRNWTWIMGNHDPVPATVGGQHQDEITVDGITFRHIAGADPVAEVSGHYHPKARIGATTRPCFLIDEARVIMPAYGTYTGGLWCDDPALRCLMQPRALAIMTGTRAIARPMHLDRV